MAGGYVDPNASPAQIANTVNDVIRAQQANERTTVFKDDSGVRRVLLGKGSDNFYGLKVSQEGVDVYDASDDDLVFNSNNNVFKIVATGTVTVNKPASTASAATIVAHGLGYAPVGVVYLDDGSTIVAIPFSAHSLAGATAGLCTRTYSFVVDSSDLTITVTAPNWAGNTSYTDELNFTVRYYLLQETAN